LVKGCSAPGFGVPDALINSSEGRLVFVIHGRRLLLEFRFLRLGHPVILAPVPARCKKTRGNRGREIGGKWEVLLKFIELVKSKKTFRPSPVFSVVMKREKAKTHP